jgi:hypothetical protein
MPSLKKLMADAGLNVQQQNDILREMSAVSDNSDGVATRPRTSEVHAALRSAFPEIDAAAVVRHLAKRGFLFDDGVASVNAAAAVTVSDSNFKLHQRIKAEAARLGFDYTPGRKVDPFQLDAALRGKDISARLALKANLIRIGALSANDE